MFGKNKKNKQEIKDVKKEDEVALLPLLLIDTPKTRENAETQKVKECMIKYKAIYCPAGDSKTLGMLLFGNNATRQAFYDEINDFVDLGVGECFVFAKKKFVPKEVVLIAEEFWNTYYKEGND